MRPTLERAESFAHKITGIFKLGYEERSGAGAASLEVPVSHWTSTGAAQAVTLADGEEGQIKIIIHAVDGGSIAITPANYGGVTSATTTLAAAGDTAVFMFIKGNWWLIAFGTQTAIASATVTHA